MQLLKPADQSRRAWRFRCLLSTRGEDLIDRWHSKISKRGRAKLERAMEHLAVQEKSEWTRPDASCIGNHIYVIRFKDENSTQHRIAGHFHENSNVFVLTQPVIEKDNEYDPRNFADLASDHKATCDDDFDGRSAPCFYLDVHRREDERSARANEVHRGVDERSYLSRIY